MNGRRAVGRGKLGLGGTDGWGRVEGLQPSGTLQGGGTDTQGGFHEVLLCGGESNSLLWLRVNSKCFDDFFMHG